VLATAASAVAKSSFISMSVSVFAGGKKNIPKSSRAGRAFASAHGTILYFISTIQNRGQHCASAGRVNRKPL